MGESLGLSSAAVTEKLKARSASGGAAGGGGWGDVVWRLNVKREGVCLCVFMKVGGSLFSCCALSYTTLLSCYNVKL